MATGKNSPRRQGAVAVDSTASAIAPMMMGGIYKATAGSVSASSDATMFLTDAYGRLETVTNTGSVDEITNLATFGGQAPQWDDTDKLAVSLYGKVTDAGDTPLLTNATRGQLVVAGGRTSATDGRSNVGAALVSCARTTSFSSWY